jgi:hypothetical protein
LDPSSGSRCRWRYPLFEFIFLLPLAESVTAVRLLRFIFQLAPYNCFNSSSSCRRTVASILPIAVAFVSEHCLNSASSWRRTVAAIHPIAVAFVSEHCLNSASSWRRTVAAIHLPVGAVQLLRFIFRFQLLLALSTLRIHLPVGAVQVLQFSFRFQLPLPLSALNSSSSWRRTVASIHLPVAVGAKCSEFLFLLAVPPPVTTT